MKRLLIAVLAMAVIGVVAENGLAQRNPRGTAKISCGEQDDLSRIRTPFFEGPLGGRHCCSS